jgi:RHS repeat-associated protein
VYTYDANGNLTGTTAGQSFTYDAFNRMTQAVGTGGTATYTYNGAGLKVQRVGPDGTTRYYYNGFRPIWETDGIGTMTAELDRDIFGNLLSRREASGIRRYYHPDGLGSTIGLTDEAGNVAATMLYDSWGQVRTSVGVGIGKYQFTGAEMDSATGLYHMGARFYDPSIGRWLSEDPSDVGLRGVNIYAYASMNPQITVDPSGLDDGCATATCDPRNEAAYAATSTPDPVASYEAWLGAAQAGDPPPNGWEVYAPSVLAASKKYGMSPGLVFAVIWRESVFDPTAIGNVGEIGLMQVMPSTASDYGLPLTEYSAELLKNPAINIDVGTAHLARLRATVHGGLEQVLAAYNQGATAARRNGLGPSRDYIRDILGYFEWMNRTKCGGFC